jgi:hypothetical protein
MWIQPGYHGLLKKHTPKVISDKLHQPLIPCCKKMLKGKKNQTWGQTCFHNNYLPPGKSGFLSKQLFPWRELAL